METMGWKEPVSANRKLATSGRANVSKNAVPISVPQSRQSPAPVLMPLHEHPALQSEAFDRSQASIPACCIPRPATEQVSSTIEQLPIGPVAGGDDTNTVALPPQRLPVDTSSLQ